MLGIPKYEHQTHDQIEMPEKSELNAIATDFKCKLETARNPSCYPTNDGLAPDLRPENAKIPSFALAPRY